MRGNPHLWKHPYRSVQCFNVFQIAISETGVTIRTLAAGPTPSPASSPLIETDKTWMVNLWTASHDWSFVVWFGQKLGDEPLIIWVHQNRYLCVYFMSIYVYIYTCDKADTNHLTVPRAQGSIPMFYRSCEVMSLGPVSSQILQTCRGRA